MRRMSTLLVLIATLICTTSLTAQELERRGSLGVMIANLDEELATQTGRKAGDGVYVRDVLPGSTGATFGLQAGDVLIHLDHEAATDVGSVVAITRNWIQGQEVEGRVWREGELVDFSGSVIGKPMEESAIADVIYDAVPFRDGSLRSILHLPKERGTRTPLLIYLQGFGCGSIDYYYNPSSVIRQFVDGLVAEGFAVYRVEKPGLGDSDNSDPCSEIGYRTELEAFDAAMTDIAGYDFIDQDNIFYFGHSLGGVTAPQLAVKHQPKGVAVYGTVLKSWYEYMINVYREQNIRTGDDWMSVESSARDAQAFLARLFVMKQSPEEMMEDPQVKDQLENGILGFDGETHFMGRHYTFWQELNEANFAEAWQEAGVHTLAIYGEHDIHAIDPTDTRYIADLVNTYHPGKGRFQLLEGTEHGFASVPGMEEYVRLRRSGEFTGTYMAEHYNPEVVKVLVAWMEELIGRA